MIMTATEKDHYLADLRFDWVWGFYSILVFPSRHLNADWLLLTCDLTFSLYIYVDCFFWGFENLLCFANPCPESQIPFCYLLYSDPGYAGSLLGIGPFTLGPFSSPLVGLSYSFPEAVLPFSPCAPYFLLKPTENFCYFCIWYFTLQHSIWPFSTILNSSWKLERTTDVTISKVDFAIWRFFFKKKWRLSSHMI